MNTLRVKLTVLLVVAIVSVIGILTGLVFYLFPPPKPDRNMDPLTRQVETMALLARGGPDALPLAPQPASGPEDAFMTQRLRTQLAARGTEIPVTVTHGAPGRPRMVSIPMQGGWLLMELPGGPPRDGGWTILLRWLVLITVGATAIAVFAANRMVRPLVLLENAVASIGPDATLPRLPERGPAEVRATAKALNSLSTRLKAAMESRMRLVAAAGHDLRTPITRMRLRAEFVVDDEDRALWLRDLEELERIADSAILLVREESAKAPPEVIRLDALVAGIVGELKQQKYDIDLTAAAPVRVHAGRLALARALRNLMINAATHGVRARVSVATTKDGAARITITDDGPGIAPELLGQVFEPFFRADPARRQNIPGAGLGLTIAREIIGRAGGTIAIANGAVRGLVQTVDLPAYVPAAA